jgi:NarL family two-component system sensor histidine kinase LiaS
MNKLRMFNMKWQLLGYFFTASLIMVSTMYIALEYYASELGNLEFRLGFLGILLLAGLSIGYVVTKRWQRKIDTIHLAILELTKGNYTNRIDIEPVEPFRYLYHSFNLMASAVEERLQLLQSLGEDEGRREQELNEKAVMEERRRLARDLHDTVSQELFAIHMAASSLPKIIERNPDAALNVMEQLISMSHHAQKQMRGLITQLRPIELDDQTLEQALEKWFPDSCRANELQGRLEIVLTEPLSEAIEHQLFLIIQEGMANVVKHASARSIGLSIHEREHQYIVQLEDNGRGFNRSEIPTTSHGLTTMRERAKKLGGNVEVFSKLGSGTRVRVQIPKFVEAKQVPEKEVGKNE